MKRKWYFSEIFHTQYCFDMCYAVKSSEVDLKLKTKTEFPNVLGETIAIPIYTVLPCCVIDLVILQVFFWSITILMQWLFHMY